MSSLNFGLKGHNTSQQPPFSFPYSFSIPAETDLWLKPPPLGSPPTTLPIIASNQPTFYSCLPISSFLRAEAIMSFVPQQLYDQAGLVLLFPGDEKKWIKAGLEYVDGQTKRSTVVSPGGGRGADWSVSPLVQGKSSVRDPREKSDEETRVSATIEFERDEGGCGSSLLVKIQGETVREITWVFGTSWAEEEIWVGFYGARPAKGKLGHLDILVEKCKVNVNTI